LFSFSNVVFYESFHDNKFLELKLYARNQWSLGGAVKEELEYRIVKRICRENP
jgi:hypothetical protein